MKSIDCILGKKVEVEDKATGNTDAFIEWSDNFIFCEFQSLSYKEFYQAQSSGFKPEMNLKISSWDYENQEYVRYENEVYTILKTYVIADNPDSMLLTLVRGIKDVYTKECD